MQYKLLKLFLIVAFLTSLTQATCFAGTPIINGMEEEMSARERMWVDIDHHIIPDMDIMNIYILGVNSDVTTKNLHSKYLLVVDKYKLAEILVYKDENGDFSLTLEPNDIYRKISPNHRCVWTNLSSHGRFFGQIDPLVYRINDNGEIVGDGSRNQGVKTVGIFVAEAAKGFLKTYFSTQATTNNPEGYQYTLDENIRFNN